MRANETLNRWNHKKWPAQINPCTECDRTIAIGDMDAEPIGPTRIALDILAMDKTTAAEIIAAIIGEVAECYRALDNLHSELDLLKGGAMEAVRKSEEAAREMTQARERFAPVVKKLRDEGMSWNQIADMTGINRSTIRQWAK